MNISNYECPVFIVAFDTYRLLKLRIVKKENSTDIITLPSEQNDDIPGDSILDSPEVDFSSWNLNSIFNLPEDVNPNYKTVRHKKPNKNDLAISKDIKNILQDFFSTTLISIDISEYRLINSDLFYTDFCITNKWFDKDENMELLILIPKIIK